MDKRKILKRIIAISLIAIPFVLGFIGFADLYEDIGSRLYHTMALYPFTEDVDTEAANILMEIEHTRWERFYWLHNWEYNPLRNDAKHQHPSLVPFYKLSRKDQLKDYDMYRKIAG